MKLIKKYQLFFAALITATLIAVCILRINSGAGDKTASGLPSSEKDRIGIALSIIHNSQSHFTEIDKKKLSDIYESLPGKDQQILASMASFLARGKTTSINDINTFDTITSQIKSGNANQVSASLKNLPDINKVRSASGYNLLMIAISVHASIPILEALIESGIDLNAVDEQGRTACHQLLYSGATDRKPLDLLKEHGADFNIKDKAGVSVNDLLNGESH